MEFEDATSPVCKSCESDEKFNKRTMVCEEEPKVVYKKKSKPVVRESQKKSKTGCS